MIASDAAFWFGTSVHAVFVSDGRGAILFANDPARRLLGIRTARALGGPCWVRAGFEDQAGLPVCSPACRIRDGSSGIGAVYRRGRRGVRRRLELVTFQPAENLVLHIIPAAAAGRESRPEGPCSGLWSLSRREREILELLAAGIPAPSIADRLFISPVTVNNHIRRILAKMGVHNRVCAVLAWLHQRSSIT